MGTVHSAWDPTLARQVAVKVLSGADPEAVMRFGQEARAAARLQHPNIVGVHDVVSEGGMPCIVMDLVPGRTLEAWLGDDEPGLAEIVRVVEQVARALQHAHEEGVVHRDVKPANIMMDARGTRS